MKDPGDGSTGLRPLPNHDVVVGIPARPVKKTFAQTGDAVVTAYPRSQPSQPVLVAELPKPTSERLTERKLAKPSSKRTGPAYPADTRVTRSHIKDKRTVQPATAAPIDKSPVAAASGQDRREKEVPRPVVSQPAPAPSKVTNVTGSSAGGKAVATPKSDVPKVTKTPEVTPRPEVTPAIPAVSVPTLAPIPEPEPMDISETVAAKPTGVPVVISDRPEPKNKKKVGRPSKSQAEADQPVDTEKSLPRWIEAVKDKYLNAKGFDVIEFINNVRVDTITFSDLMYWSPALRRLVTQSFKTVPREQQIKLLLLEPYLYTALAVTQEEAEGKIPWAADDAFDEPSAVRYARYVRTDSVSTSTTGTHKVMVTANGSPVQGSLDNGCCVICVQGPLRKRLGWTLTTKTPSIQLRTATGGSTNIEGEVHGFVIRISNYIEVPVNVLSVTDLDVPLLLGRPFLEILQCRINCERALYNVIWNKHWATIDGATGVTYYHRTITAPEMVEWREHSRPPKTGDEFLDANDESDSSKEEEEVNDSDFRKGSTPSDETSNPSGGSTVPSASSPDAPKIYRMAIDYSGPKAYEMKDEPLKEEIKDLRQDLNEDEYSYYSLENVPGEIGSLKWWRDAKKLIHRSRVMEDSIIPDHLIGLTRVSGNSNEKIRELNSIENPNRPLSILSWNVNSVRNIIKASSPFTGANGGLSENALGAYVERMGIDVLVLQEVRLTSIGDAKPGVASIPGYVTYFTFATHIKGYSGVAIYARSGLVSTIYEGFVASSWKPEDVEGRVLQCVIGKTVIMGIYAPNARDQPEDRERYKKDFFAAVSRDVEYHQELGYEVVVIGDYNVVYRKEDAWDQRLMTGSSRISPCADWEEELIRGLKKTHSLIDPHLLYHQRGQPRFSCWEQGKLRGKSRKELDHGFRIDYALISKSLQADVTECRLLREEGSDHIPLILRIKQRSGTNQVPTQGAIALVHPGPLKSESGTTNDWKLNPVIVTALQEHWGDQFGKFQMDLFANHHNAQFEKYCVEDDPAGRIPNAWSIDWADAQGEGMLWANPPWKSIPKLLRKVRETKTTVAIVAPVSPQNQWYGELLSLAVADPIVLPRAANTFLREGKEAKGATPWGMTAVWLVSGEPARRETYAATLTMKPRKRGPITPVTSDFAGYVEGKWIPWRYLDFPVTAQDSPTKPEVRRLMQMEVEPPMVESIEVGGATIRWKTYEGKTATPVRQMDPSRTGGRIINIGDLPEVDEYRDEIEQMFEDHLDEILEPGGIARTLTNVEPMTVSLDHDLIKKHGGLPVARPLRVSPEQEKVLNQYQEKMERANKIEEATSTTSALPLLVKKKDGSWRIVLNYAPIGKFVRPLIWPLEPMDAVLQKMARHKYRCSFDHSLGYHQIPVHPDYRWLTAFVLPRGLFQYTVAPQGWKDSAEWLAKHLRRVYDDREYAGDNLLDEFMALFRDDGMVGEDIIKALIPLTRRVLQCVKRANGTLSDKKSFWFVIYCFALGFLVGNGEIIPEESKIRAVLEWPSPKTQSNLKSQIMFAQFLKHMVPEYGSFVGRLYPLFKAEYARTAAFQKEWISNPDYSLAMTQLKEAFGKAASVRAFDPKRPVIIAADASPTGIGGVAGHAENPEDDDKITVNTVYSPCAFYSRQLTPAEAKLGQPYREMLGVIDVIRKCEHYLSGKIVIFTDHKAWVSTHNEMTPIANKKVDMMRAYLSTLPCEAGYPKFIFREGKKQLDVDPLSRMEDQPTPDVELPVDDIVAERVEDPVVLRMALIKVGWQPYDDIVRWLRGDDISDMNSAHRKSIVQQALHYCIGQDDGKLYRRTLGGAAPRLVPKREDIIPLIRKFHGGHEQIGHLQVAATYALMAPRYYWDNMWATITQFILACDACNKRKNKYPVGRFQLHRITPPPTLFVLLGMDGCSLPKSYDGYCGFLLIICYTSNWVQAVPVRKFDGKKAKEVIRKWCMKHGYPQWIICDRGSYFLSKEVTEYTDEHNILLCPTASQHPMGNGRAEAANGFLVALIAKRLLASSNPKPNRWSDHLDGGVADFRHHTPRTTGVSAFRFAYGQDARLPTDNADDIHAFQPEELKNMRSAFLDEVEKMREKAHELKMKEVAREEAKNRDLPPPHRYKVGDLVWVRDDKWYNTFSTKRKVVALNTLCRIRKVNMGDTYVVIEAETGNHYRDGHPVSHWRMRPISLKPTALDVGQPKETVAVATGKRTRQGRAYQLEEVTSCPVDQQLVCEEGPNEFLLVTGHRSDIENARAKLMSDLKVKEISREVPSDIKENPHGWFS